MFTIKTPKMKEGRILSWLGILTGNAMWFYTCKLVKWQPVIFQHQAVKYFIKLFPPANKIKLKLSKRLFCKPPLLYSYKKYFFGQKESKQFKQNWVGLYTSRRWIYFFIYFQFVTSKVFPTACLACTPPFQLLPSLIELAVEGICCLNQNME